MTRTNTFRIHQIAPFVVLACAAVAASATARAADYTMAQQIACAPDAYRLCSAAIPNVNKITACMIAKKASLSPACRSMF